VTGPFEVVGDEAPVCVDGVCQLPAEATDEPEDAGL